MQFAGNIEVIAGLSISLILVTGSFNCVDRIVDFAQAYLQRLSPFSEDRSWKITEEVGKGGSGLVYKIAHRRDPEKIRAFKVSKDAAHEELLLQEARNYETLRRLRIPHLAQYYRTSILTEPTEPHRNLNGLMVEYVDGKNLSDYLEEFFYTHSDQNRFNADRSQFLIQYFTYLLQIVDFLEAIHKSGFIAMDINPKNYIVRNGSITVLDPALIVKLKFVQIQMLLDQMKTIRASMPYFPIDDWHNNTISESSDFYGVGMMALEAVVVSMRDEEVFRHFSTLAGQETRRTDVYKFISQTMTFENTELYRYAKTTFYALLGASDTRPNSAEKVRTLLRGLIDKLKVL